MMKQKNTFKTLLIIAVYLSLLPDILAGTVTITEFGAKSNNVTVNTTAIQKAIDFCAASGGGNVVIPLGVFVTGTLEIKENVTLYLEHGAVLKGSSSKSDYIQHNGLLALIYSGHAENVGIQGFGKIDGNGKAFYQEDNLPGRPFLVAFDRCRNVRVQDVSLFNSAMWTLRLHKCDGVTVNRVNIYSHDNYNNDGIDIESKNVIISDCRIDTDDDALCFKSDDPECIIENITVTNCILSSNCNFIKFGTGSHGIFRNVTVSNCSLHKASESKFRNWEDLVWGVDQTTGISGIALEVVDGGLMDQINISNITMRDVQTPVFIRLGKRNKGEKTGILKNIIISNITATSESYVSSSITGIPDGRIQNVVLKDCIFNVKGGGKEAESLQEVPEVPARYPENRMFDQMLPSYGFFIRHADNIILDNVQLRYHSGYDARHAIVAEDVSLLQLKNNIWQQPNGKLKPLKIKNCPGAIIKDNIQIK